MQTRDDPMIIVTFTYGFLEGDLFCKLVGRDWVNAKEMIGKLNSFLRQKTENAKKKGRMEGKAAMRGGIREEWTKQHHVLFINNNTHF